MNLAQYRKRKSITLVSKAFEITQMGHHCKFFGALACLMGALGCRMAAHGQSVGGGRFGAYLGRACGTAEFG